MRLLTIILILLGVATQSVGQTSDAAPSTINQIDSRGTRNGMWLISQPARMGESAFSEFGTYDHGSRTGTWYRSNQDGDIVAIEHYKYSVLDGEVKYFEQGALTCIGHYRGMNPVNRYDTFVVVNPVTMAEFQKIIPSDRGTLRHGLWRYYDPQTGRLIKEEEYQVDDLIYSKKFNLTKEDSLYYQKKIQKLPHNTGTYYQPPASKRMKI